MGNRVLNECLESRVGPVGTILYSFYTRYHMVSQLNKAQFSNKFLSANALHLKPYLHMTEYFFFKGIGILNYVNQNY